MSLSGEAAARLSLDFALNIRNRHRDLDDIANDCIVRQLKFARKFGSDAILVQRSIRMRR